MRSLWKNIGFVEVALSQLQKVGDELSATPRYCSISIARGLPSFEVYIS
jgi:hypothetical protein